MLSWTWIHRSKRCVQAPGSHSSTCWLSQRDPAACMGLLRYLQICSCNPSPTFKVNTTIKVNLHVFYTRLLVRIRVWFSLKAAFQSSHRASEVGAERALRGTEPRGSSCSVLLGLTAAQSPETQFPCSSQDFWFHCFSPKSTSFVPFKFFVCFLVWFFFLIPFIGILVLQVWLHHQDNIPLPAGFSRSGCCFF